MHSLGEVQNQSQALIYTLSLIGRSAKLHLKRFLPASKNSEKPIYAGKMESLISVMALDVGGVREKDIKEKKELFRYISAFNLMWRAYDEVIEKQGGHVTEDQLDTTPVSHKYMGREVTGQEAKEIALESLSKLIPGEDRSSVRKREEIIKLLLLYRQQIVEVANNPKYNNFDILPLDLCLDIKRETTGVLGEIGIEIIFKILGIDDEVGIRLFGQMNTAMQWGDDMADWKKDWNEHEQLKKKGNLVRPLENLFLSTLEEFPMEKEALIPHLVDPINSILLIQKFAPQTLEQSLKIFEAELEALPAHRCRDKIKGFCRLTFYKGLPNAPETGKLHDWIEGVDLYKLKRNRV
ncbi:hypothetical protein HZA76_04695 [Candidatus Roizmanbacteria bacterium]|nr:hypothetical protein [Candidatus Roizmanbacteria bacterium]